MFAINHAASALIFKKQLKNEISMVWILIAVQFVEFLWVVLNLLGYEKTVTEETVRYVGDIHLSYMPFSHSIISSVLLAILGGILLGIWKRSLKVTVWMTFAFFSHILLDIYTHAPDLPLTLDNKHFIGLGLYSSAPFAGFLVEFCFGIFCWWFYKGNKTLFWIILLFNVANLTMFLPQVKGLEFYMANKPTLIAIVILIQIVITLYFVGQASRNRKV